MRRARSLGCVRPIGRLQWFAITEQPGPDKSCFKNTFNGACWGVGYYTTTCESPFLGGEFPGIFPFFLLERFALIDVTRTFVWWMTTRWWAECASASQPHISRGVDDDGLASCASCYSLDWISPLFGFWKKSVVIDESLYIWSWINR